MPQLSTNERKILIIENADENQTNLQKLLSQIKNRNYQLQVERSGSAALDICKRFHPDCILLDNILPDTDGLGFINRYKEQTHSPSTLPIILFVSPGNDEIITRAMDLGIQDYFLKSSLSGDNLQEALENGFRKNLLTKQIEQAETERQKWEMDPEPLPYEFERLRFIMNESQEIILICDPHQEYRFVDVNEQACMLLGYTRRELLNLRFHDIEQFDLEKGPEELNQRLKQMRTSRRRMLLNSVLKRKDGVTLPVEFSTRLELFDGHEYILTVAREDSQVKRETLDSRPETRTSASQNSLAKLPDRNQFLEELEKALARTRRRAGYKFAVLFLDLDHFKSINDNMGHEIGNLLLIECARRLSSILRTGDEIAHFGGDEFAVLIDDIRHSRDAIRIAEKIQSELLTPFEIANRRILTTASIGLAFSESGYANSQEILRGTDTAMNEAKAKGKARFAVFDPKMQARTLDEAEQEERIRKGLESNEFQVYLQPMTHLPDGQVFAYEALVRWQHPEQGLLVPAVFLPLAEKSGLISSMDRLVLNEGLRQLSRWYTQGKTNLKLFVNVSDQEWQRSDFCPFIRNTLRKYGISGKHLVLEIKENVLMNRALSVLQSARDLRESGVMLAIDNFGTGYSSLQMLRNYPIHSLKIARQLISGLPNDLNSQALVQATLSLADIIGIKTMAEGVETKEQVNYLTNLNCVDMQGFYFGRPTPLTELQNL